MGQESAVAREDFKKAEHKLLILLMVKKMDLPLSNAQISQFAREEELLDYFDLQEALLDLVASGYLEETHDNNQTRFAITDEGITTLSYFEKQIHADLRGRINKYVAENRKSVKRDFEVTANYFYEHASNEFIVKCGIYEDEAMLMEINVSVVTREQARFICNNWKRNVNILYGNIIGELVQPKDAGEFEIK